MKFVTSSGEVM